jgi:hypothetical protein
MRKLLLLFDPVQRQQVRARISGDIATIRFSGVSNVLSRLCQQILVSSVSSEIVDCAKLKHDLYT